MNDYFAKNISALKTHSPASASLSNSLPGSIKVQTARTGRVTARAGNILLHSSYDPEKEGSAFAEKARSGSMVCLYGFGLGYHIAPLLDRIGPEGFLLVIELNPDLLSAAMILRDQTDVLSHHRFRLIFGEDEATVAAEILKYMERFNSYPDSQQEVLFHSPSFNCLPKQFPRIANALEVLLMERRFPAVLGGLEDENYQVNLETVTRTPGIDTLKNAHRGRAAVLVSAGPSLDDVLPYLARMAGQIVLSCVDTSLPILLREGIAPDYVFSLDPQEESYQYFTEKIPSPGKLVFTPTACAKVVLGFSNEKFVVFKEGSALSESGLASEKGTTKSGGSVSCLGLDCLIRFGCDPVFLIGQDLAFSGLRNYSRHSSINEQLLDKVDQKKTLTESHLEKSRQQKQVRVECADGREVFTSQVMYSYLRTLEQIAGASPKIRIYNLCSHGAPMENITPLGSVNELMNILNKF